MKAHDDQMVAVLEREILIKDIEVLGLSGDVLRQLIWHPNARVAQRVSEVLRKLPKKTKGYNSRAEELDRIYGLHSNIPECCVEYFCESNILIARNFPNLGWHQIREVSGAVRRYNMWPVLGIEFEPALRYHPCPECVRGIAGGFLAPNELHECLTDSLHPICQKMNNDPWEIQAQILK